MKIPTRNEPNRLQLATPSGEALAAPGEALRNVGAAVEQIASRQRQKEQDDYVTQKMIEYNHDFTNVKQEVEARKGFEGTKALDTADTVFGDNYVESMISDAPNSEAAANASNAIKMAYSRNRSAIASHVLRSREEYSRSLAEGQVQSLLDKSKVLGIANTDQILAEAITTGLENARTLSISDPAEQVNIVRRVTDESILTAYSDALLNEADSAVVKFDQDIETLREVMTNDGFNRLASAVDKERGNADVLTAMKVFKSMPLTLAISNFANPDFLAKTGISPATADRVLGNQMQAVSAMYALENRAYDEKLKNASIDVSQLKNGGKIEEARKLIQTGGFSITDREALLNSLATRERSVPSIYDNVFNAVYRGQITIPEILAIPSDQLSSDDKNRFISILGSMNSSGDKFSGMRNSFNLLDKYLVAKEIEGDQAIALQNAFVQKLAEESLDPRDPRAVNILTEMFLESGDNWFADKRNANFVADTTAKFSKDRRYMSIGSGRISKITFWSAEIFEKTSQREKVVKILLDQALQLRDLRVLDNKDGIIQLMEQLNSSWNKKGKN